LFGLVLVYLFGVGYWTYSPFKAKQQVIREVSIPRLLKIDKEVTVPLDFRNVYQTMSLTSFDRINVTFRNTTDQDADLYWIDFAGSEKWITTIRSGGSATVETFVGQLWEAKTRSGDPLGSYVVEGS
jgi:hypothetical protein